MSVDKAIAKHKELVLERKLEYKPSLNLLVPKVIQWFYDRGLENADSLVQYVKLTEEVSEVGDAIVKNDTESLIDGIGDTLVVLIGLCLQNNLDIEECLETAYNEIKNRKGKMVNGMFVKENKNEIRLRVI